MVELLRRLYGAQVAIFHKQSAVVGSIDLYSAGPEIESRLECWLN